MTTKPDGPAYPPGVRLLASVTRLEVIDDTGRALTYPAGEPMEVELSFQDDDRTLKVFVRGRRHEPNTSAERELAALRHHMNKLATSWEKSEGSLIEAEDAYWECAQSVHALLGDNPSHLIGHHEQDERERKAKG